jgi:4-amino-4-deoxy-L-arabinose transferase-like glycosyltransferase
MGDMYNRIRAWAARHPCWTLTVLVGLALGPFLAKPFNIDDPLFLWAAHQIQAHPGDPYGFNVNWYASVTPMSVATENPPGACYYAALAVKMFGWSEPALHGAFLLPALAVILGTWRLARRLCGQPLLAACATLFTPVFLVSSGTVMSDVLMLAFWVWAVVFWVEGLEADDYGKLSVAGGLIALSMLSKYFGVALLPLLAAYSLVEKRRFGPWAGCLLIPLAAMCAYQWITHALYGRALMTETIEYTAFAKGIVGQSRFTSALLALAYTGGCLAVSAFFLPLVWRRRSAVWFAGGLILIGAAVWWQNGLLRPSIPLAGAARLFTELQTVFWIVIGISVLVLTGADLRRHRDGLSLLLCLWMLGTFGFAAFCNWTVNGRSILPMAPAVGILLARAWEARQAEERASWPSAVVAALGLAAVLSFCVAWSDMQVAQTSRQSARETFAKFHPKSGKLWFQGHWGFQYYMDLLGGAALDMTHPALKTGDILVVPIHNCYIFEPLPEVAETLAVIRVPGPRWLTTWSADVGAGFYSFPGPLPFAFGQVPPDEVAVYRWKTNSPAVLQK